MTNQKKIGGILLVLSLFAATAALMFYRETVILVAIACGILSVGFAVVATLILWQHNKSEEILEGHQRRF